MPSSNESWSKVNSSLKGSRILRLVALAAFLSLGGCIAVDEAKFATDVPLGPDYTPVVIRQPWVWPLRVLVLPVSGEVHDDVRAEFERQFLAQLKARNLWAILDYDGANSFESQLAITEDAAIVRARALNADAILQVKLGDENIYAPLRVTAEIVVEDVASRQPLLKMTADYDARNKLVATSARRYFQKEVRNRDFPDKSFAVLDNRTEFMSFTGYYSAELIANAFISKHPVKAEQAGPSPAPDPGSGTFAPNPNQGPAGK